MPRRGERDTRSVIDCPGAAHTLAGVHVAMKIAIMQPYLLPYIGYFQLIAAVDRFVVYDNIKYTKKGWINRNRMLFNGEPSSYSVPLKRDSDLVDVCDRHHVEDFDRRKLLDQIRGAYRGAPHFAAV